MTIKVYWKVQGKPIAVMGKNYINPLCAVAGWGEVYMNASMESIVNGYEDPRGKKWYNTALLERL